MHGSIGPSCAVGLFEDGELTVWMHTQGVYPAAQAIAELLRLPEEECTASIWKAPAATAITAPTMPAATPR